MKNLARQRILEEGDLSGLRSIAVKQASVRSRVEELTQLHGGLMFDQRRGTASDEELLLACSEGDSEAYSQLWEHHRRAGLVAARNLAPSLDAEEVVSEAYLKIFELLCDGRGPRGAFRPYLYRVIKTVAADHLRSPERSSAELEDIPELHESGPWEDNAFDLNATATAFSTLSPRWQAVLWYTEVEQLPPREAAVLLGLSPNSVSALAVRARESLKSAWVEAHVNREIAEAECRRTLEHLQRYQRGKLTSRLAREVGTHLDACTNCSNAAAEYSSLNRRLGLTLAAAVLGGTGAAAIFDGSRLGTVNDPSTFAATSSATTAAVASPATGLSAGVLTGAVAAAVIGAAVLVTAVLSGPPKPADATPAPSSEIAEEHDPLNSQNASKLEQAAEQVSFNANRTSGQAAHPESSDTTPAATPPSSGSASTLPATTMPTPGNTSRPPPVDPTEPPTEPLEPPVPEPDPLILDPEEPAETEQAPGSGEDAENLPGNDEPSNDEPGDADGLPEDTDEPIDLLDPALQPALLCYVEDLGFIGSANEYGVLLAQLSQHGGSPLAILDPLFDPSNPGSLFIDGLLDDGRGNSFDFGFFSGADPTSGNEWHSDILLSPLAQWGFIEDGLSSLVMEIRLITPDGRYSPWVAIDLHDQDCAS